MLTYSSTAIFIWLALALRVRCAFAGLSVPIMAEAGNMVLVAE